MSFQSQKTPHSPELYQTHNERNRKLNVKHECISTDRVKQHCANILSVAVLQARPTELTFAPHTETAATHCLGVQSFLSALVTRASLKEKHKCTQIVKKSTTPANLVTFYSTKQHWMDKSLLWLTFSLSQILSLLRYAILSRSSLVISSTDFTSYWLLLELWLFLFFRFSPLCISSTCPITTDRF